MVNIKKVLITGGNSFLGSHLADKLTKEGINVSCLVRKTSDLSSLKQCPAEVCCAEMSDDKQLAQVLQNIDAVFHIAAVKRAKTKKEYFDINETATENMVKACIKSGSVKRFIYISSVAVSGPSQNGEPITENTPCNPITYYGASKLAGEKAVEKYMNKLPSTILRPPAIYGPRDKDIYQFFKTINLHIKPLFTGGKRFFNLTYVEDVVNGIILAAKSEQAAGKTYILCDDNHYTQEFVLATIAETLNKKPVTIYIPQWLFMSIAYLNEGTSFIAGSAALLNRQKAKELLAINWLCNPVKIKKELGFTGSFSLKEGIKKTYEWYKENKWL